MRCAIISDIHSNREALEAVLLTIGKLRVDKILCLGDVVGYNADPGFCVAKTLSVSASAVRGNHDKAVAGLMNVEYFNSHAAEAVSWTRRTLDPESIAAVKNLAPGPIDAGEGILLCHGSPQEEDLYLVSEESVRDAFARLRDFHAGARICFFGHTHMPLAIDNQMNLLNTEGAVFLEKDRVHLINPGSVGQPRDNNPDAAFGILDDDDRIFTFYRVPYAVKETQQKILRAGLPPVLAHRLTLGR
ncbi:MAG: metallophosphoesterase family protein [Spirochaetales bacterium]|nr:metallophosphoesterase family protein [Spirochaetales bacterium]